MDKPRSTTSLWLGERGGATGIRAANLCRLSAQSPLGVARTVACEGLAELNLVGLFDAIKHSVTSLWSRQSNMRADDLQESTLLRWYRARASSVVCNKSESKPA